MSTFCNLGPSKIYPNRDFSFESKPSGNLDLDPRDNGDTRWRLVQRLPSASGWHADQAGRSTAAAAGEWPQEQPRVHPGQLTERLPGQREWGRRAGIHSMKLHFGQKLFGQIFILDVEIMVRGLAYSIWTICESNQHSLNLTKQCTFIHLYIYTK
jgi:hypothetical protein